MNTCYPLGIPRNTVFETRGIAFATMPDRITVLHQYQRIWRYVWMDGRELPKKFDTAGGVPSRWYGYSVGHWEGDNTLVIDTVGSNDQSWLDKAGLPHSVDAHIQERYTRVDHLHVVMVHASVAFLYVGIDAVRMASLIKPTLVVGADGVDHERVITFPMANRVSVPTRRHAVR